MKMGKQTTHGTKAAALYMLKNGLASYKEIAELSGRSRQIIRIWGGRVDAPEARKRYLQRLDPRQSVAPLIATRERPMVIGSRVSSLGTKDAATVARHKNIYLGKSLSRM
jgi:hypothetical protein